VLLKNLHEDSLVAQFIVNEGVQTAGGIISVNIDIHLIWHWVSESILNAKVCLYGFKQPAIKRFYSNNALEPNGRYLINVLLFQLYFCCCFSKLSATIWKCETILFSFN